MWLPSGRRPRAHRDGWLTWLVQRRQAGASAEAGHATVPPVLQRVPLRPPLRYPAMMCLEAWCFGWFHTKPSDHHSNVVMARFSGVFQCMAQSTAPSPLYQIICPRKAASFHFQTPITSVSLLLRLSHSAATKANMIAAQRSIAISTSHRHQAAAASLSGVSSVPHNSINHKLMDAHRSMHARQTSQPSPAGRTSFSSDPEQPLMMASHPVSRRNHHLPTIALLSDAVAIQAETQRFERFAGRSAMVSK